MAAGFQVWGSESTETGWSPPPASVLWAPCPVAPLRAPGTSQSRGEAPVSSPCVCRGQGQPSGGRRRPDTREAPPRPRCAPAGRGRPRGAAGSAGAGAAWGSHCPPPRPPGPRRAEPGTAPPRGLAAGGRGAGGYLLMKGDQRLRRGHRCRLGGGGVRRWGCRSRGAPRSPPQGLGAPPCAPGNGRCSHVVVRT